MDPTENIVPIPSLTTLARNALREEDFGNQSWTPIGPRRGFLTNFRDLATNNSAPTAPRTSGSFHKLPSSQVIVVNKICNLIKNVELTKEKALRLGVKSITFQVFEMEQFPGTIFKMDSEGEEPQQRVEAISKFQEAIERKNLKRFALPQAYYLTNDCQIIAEQKLSLISQDYSLQREIWNYCLREPALKPLMKSIIRELTLLICETGLHDIREDNIPLLSDGSGIGLVDIELSGNPCKGLMELLNILTPDFFETVRENLNQYMIQKLDFDSICQTRTLKIQANNLLDQYHIKKGISIGNETVSLELEENPVLCKTLIDMINEKIKQREGESLQSQRKISFFKKDIELPTSSDHESISKIDQILEIFKQKHVIFSFTKQIFFNATEYYMIQC